MNEIQLALTRIRASSEGFDRATLLAYKQLRHAAAALSKSDFLTMLDQLIDDEEQRQK